MDLSFALLALFFIWDSYELTAVLEFLKLQLVSDDNASPSLWPIRHLTILLAALGRSAGGSGRRSAAEAAEGEQAN